MKKEILPGSSCSTTGMLVVILSLIFLLTTGGIKVFSQDQTELYFKHITYRDGLGGNRVFAIVRDDRGIMWFGTENSLARYDGQTLKTYHYDINDSTSIKGNAVSVLLINRQNQLCVGTDLGLLLYDPACDQFIPVSEKGINFVRRNVIDLDMNSKGTLFISFLYQITRYVQGSKVMVPFLDLSSEREIFSADDYVCQTEVTLKDQILVFTAKKWVLLDSLKQVLAQKQHQCGIIHSVQAVSGGKYLIASGNGLFLFNLLDYSLQSMSDYTGIKEFSRTEFWDAFEDPSGNIWAATDHDGIILFQPRKGEIKKIESDPFDPKSLNDNFVRKFYLDPTGILWIGSYRYGINYTHLNPSKKFIIYQYSPSRQASISSNSVLSVLKDRRGDLWIGTDGGGLNRILSETKKTIHYRYTGKEGIPSDAVLALLEDKEGKIWVGGYNGKIARYDPLKNCWEMFAPSCSYPGCTGLHDIRQIMEDSQGKIWFATNGHGLLCYNPRNQQWDSYNTLNSALVDNYTLSLLEVEDYHFWVGTYNGACLFNPKTRQGRSFSYSEKKSDGLSHNWVYALFRERKKRLWIGTANGLNLFQSEDTSFLHITTSQGLPGNVINAITEDKNGNLWISTDEGICRFNPESFSFWNLDEDDGLPGNYYLRGSCFQSDSGEIFFGSDNGLVEFKPDMIKPDTTAYPVYIKDVLLDYKTIFRDILCSEGQSSGNPRLVLPYSKRSITIQFGSLNFTNQNNNKFEYRLVGYEDYWISTGTRREVTFTKLDPGNYTFEVRGCNNDGFWDKKGDKLTIVILTPWYRTWFFRVVLALIIIGVILAYVYLRNQSILRRNRLLEQQVHERTHELEVANEELLANAEALDHTVKELESQKALLQQQTEELRTTNDRLHELNRMNDRIFSIIAHDIKNPLGTIQGFIELLTLHHRKIDENKREEYFEYIRQSVQKLLSLIENLLLWSSSQLKGRGANPVPFNLTEPVMENIDLVREQAAKKNISISFSPLEEYGVVADRNMISAVVRNILSNAVKFCKQGGEISITLRKDNDSVVCSITDQGAGMDEETKSLLFDPDKKKIRTGTGGETGSGLGLLICKEFIEQNQGSIWAESTPGAGTTFFFRIPAEKHE